MLTILMTVAFKIPFYVLLAGQLNIYIFFCFIINNEYTIAFVICFVGALYFLWLQYKLSIEVKRFVESKKQDMMNRGLSIIYRAGRTETENCAIEIQPLQPQQQ